MKQYNSPISSLKPRNFCWSENTKIFYNWLGYEGDIWAGAGWAGQLTPGLTQHGAAEPPCPHPRPRLLQAPTPLGNSRHVQLYLHLRLPPLSGTWKLPCISVRKMNINYVLHILHMCLPATLLNSRTIIDSTVYWLDSIVDVKLQVAMGETSRSIVLAGFLKVMVSLSF